LSATERYANPNLVAPKSSRLFGPLWSSQFIIALIAIAALEAVFVAMARLGDLSVHIPEFMALALGAGVLYFVALYALEHTPENRAVLWLLLLGALAFRLTLFP